MTAPSFPATPATIDLNRNGNADAGLSELLYEAMIRQCAQLRFNLSASDHTESQAVPNFITLGVNGILRDFRVHSHWINDPANRAILILDKWGGYSGTPDANIALYIALTGKGALGLRVEESFGLLEWTPVNTVFLHDRGSVNPDALEEAFRQQPIGQLFNFFGV